MSGQTGKRKLARFAASLAVVGAVVIVLMSLSATASRITGGNTALSTVGAGSGASAFEITSITAPASPTLVGSVTVETPSGHSSAGTEVQLLRYPEGGAIPNVVSTTTTSSSGRAQLIDPTLASFEHQGHYVNYAVRAIATNGIAVYHFSDLIYGGTSLVGSAARFGGSVANPEDMAISLYYGSGASVSAPRAAGPAIEFCHYENEGVKWSATEATVMGEAHSTSYETTTFQYEESAGSSLEVGLQYQGSGWQADGSVTVSNGLGYTVTWPGLSGGSAYQTESYFTYDEVYYEGFYCPVGGYYEVSATAYQGGTAWGAAVGGDNVCPTGTNWAAWLPGSSGSKQQSSGDTYSAAVSLSIGVTLSDTTAYNSYEQVSFQFATGGPTTFYTYNPNSWLIVQFSSSTYCPGGPT